MHSIFKSGEFLKFITGEFCLFVLFACESNVADKQTLTNYFQSMDHIMRDLEEYQIYDLSIIGIGK